MKTRIALVSTLLAAAAVWGGSCTPQPPLPCPIASANPYFGLTGFATFYKLKTGSGVCAGKEYESIGFQKYNQPGTPEVHLAVRPGDLGALYEAGRVDPSDPDGKKLNGLGDLPQQPGSDNFCAADFTDEHAEIAEQDFEATPDTTDDAGVVTPGEPALSMKYEWKSLKFIELSNVPGTAFLGELTYTQDGCVATYAAEGFWPEVSCSTTVTLADGGTAPRTLPDGSLDLADGGMIEDIDCAQGQDIANDHPLGSGINPDFKVACDATLNVCVLGTRDRGTRAITRIPVNELTNL